MNAPGAPRVFSIPPGVPFLGTLARALVEGQLVPGFTASDDPLALADATIYVPTRRAARELRNAFASLSPGKSAILPTVRALGEFEGEGLDLSAPAILDAAPPIPNVERLLLLAPLVQRWKDFLPDAVRTMFSEDVAVPVSTADAVWLARDLASLMDEIESEETSWAKLADLVSDDLGGWWTVTLDFLRIVSEAWPEILHERGQENPARHRNRLIRLEALRLANGGAKGPVIAAGSTGSNPAAAVLLATIARLPQGAVVLPGLDRDLDEASERVLNEERPDASVLGHPQFGLSKVLARMSVKRGDVEELGAPSPQSRLRVKAIGEALRPAATTDQWAVRHRELAPENLEDAFADVCLVEAATERDEALAIAIALRQAVSEPEHTAALATGDRDLARRVAAELGRFGIRADDSGGTPLCRTPPGTLLQLMLETAFRPGDPVTILSLLKHPLLLLGLDRVSVRRASETIELIAFRGGAGRPDILTLRELFDTRLQAIANADRQPFWLRRLDANRIEGARRLIARLGEALEPLGEVRAGDLAEFHATLRASVEALECLGRGPDGGVGALYGNDAGRALAASLRELVEAGPTFAVPVREWPDVMDAMLAEAVVRPAPATVDRRVHIWGLLEARLQTVDTLVVGGLNEGSWPAKAQADRFMSRFMKSGIELEPPERRIGLAAHDFVMAAGARKVVLTRSARSGGAPAVSSRWLQRLLTFVGPDTKAAMKARGEQLLNWAQEIDESERIDFEKRPSPKPPVDVRPKRFSVTEIETLRRDPYAVYAKRILKLEAMDRLISEPGPAERGTLFHAIMDRFTRSAIDASAPDAEAQLIAIGREAFAEAALPEDVYALWWPRFERMAGETVAWERERTDRIDQRHSEIRAVSVSVGQTGVTLSGRADRIDLMQDGTAEILDFKTGTSPSKKQAHTLLSPQMALEGALLRRGAFEALGKREPSDLTFVRLKANGDVEPESILKLGTQRKDATALSEEAWERLEKLLAHYNDPSTGYLSRALPFRENDTDGAYDHLARVLEWSAGGENDGEGAEA
ncbi:MAG: double-strand break repair protein AddB [Methylobacterium mesophilicum]|nr:double-strand break repair protein AddB [Methylobacterium mesophilicum]